MNNAVLNYYSTQLYFNKQKERRNFAAGGIGNAMMNHKLAGKSVGELFDEAVKALGLSKKNAGELNNILRLVDNDLSKEHILYYVLQKSKDKNWRKQLDSKNLEDIKEYALNIKIKHQDSIDRGEAYKKAHAKDTKEDAKSSSSSSTSDIKAAMVGSFSDIMSHNLKSGADASIGGFLTDKTGRKTFDKLAKGNTAAFFKSSGKPGKMPNEYEAGLKNLSDALAKARDIKDAAKYNKAFKLLISQAYWLAFYMNAKDNTLGERDSNRIAKYITNREATLKAWNNNTKVFLNSVASGKPAVLKKVDAKPSPGDRVKALGNRIVDKGIELKNTVLGSFFDSKDDTKKA